MISTPPTDQYLYIFLDEAGNFDFSEGGTKYFQIGCITKERPFRACHELNELKYDLIEDGLHIEYFHAAEDRQKTRDAVFEVIGRYLDTIRFDAVIVEKRKTGPALQVPEKFYPKMLGYLLQYVLNRHDLFKYKEIIVFTDSIPVAKKKKSIEKAIKETLSQIIPNDVCYRIFHHESKSNFDLQIADYFNWAVFRKWQRGDPRSYQLIQKSIASEYEIFKNGTIFYY